jgi:hypothetical protein
MSNFDHELHSLAARVGQGDVHARARLKRELEPQIHRIVRRAMRPTAGPSALTQRIRAAAHRLSRNQPGYLRPDSEQLVSQIAHDLWESVLDRADTAPQDGRLLRETVRT